VGEKMTSVLPDPSLIDLLVDDDQIPDPLVYINKSSELSVSLAEGKTPLFKNYSDNFSGFRLNFVRACSSIFMDFLF
jgi:hypothetical protein